MGINIRNERVERLARQLATATGDSMTGAIEKALEERLARHRQVHDFDERLRRLREIVGRIPPPPPGLTSDHSDLYDEHGLPK